MKTEKERQEIEQKHQRRVESAKSKTHWENQKKQQIKAKQKQDQELERENTMTKQQEMDVKLANGRRAYEEWAHRKKMEKRDASISLHFKKCLNF